MHNYKIFCLCLNNDLLNLVKELNYEPVGLGTESFSSQWLRDNTKDNISFKNKFYGEYTFHYWLWKNELNNIPNDTWIGFCTYRRFWKSENNKDEKKIFSEKILQSIPSEWNEYDTILGERGITLSGGQKQRVSIARALIKKPQIYLFDDCLSAVDTETEEEILNNLKKASKNRTTLIVSHRVSSAKNADKILVLDDGRLIQEGTHDELNSQEGYYKDLYHKQLSEKES